MNYRSVQTARLVTVQILNVLNIQLRSSMNFLPGFVWKDSLKNSVKAINPITLELNPSAQRCLTRFFTGDFAF
jgi:hypothetical protein